MASDPEIPDTSQVHAINSEASVLMKRGIKLMESASEPGELFEALKCFDSALEMRIGLPIDRDPILRYGLAACWLNRADALVRIGDDTNITLALRAYGEGIGVLLGLSMGEDPRFPRRLAIAHQNRGLALQTRGAAGSAEAIAAFREAVAVLDHDHAALIPDRSYLLAVVWMNLARSFAADSNPGSASLAREAVQRSISQVKGQEESNVEAAEVGLKARHIFCQTLSQALSTTAMAGTMPDEVHEATDIVDDGLVLARHWEKVGIGRFRSIAYDLFRFGSRVYGKYQPQFLTEFVLDNLDPEQSSPAYAESEEMRFAAQEALDQVKAQNSRPPRS